MSSPVVLLLVPGLTSQAGLIQALGWPGCACGSFAPMSEAIDPESVLLGGALAPALGSDIRVVLATYGMTTEELDLRRDEALQSNAGARSACAMGTALVIARGVDPDGWLDFASSLPELNVLVVGHSTGTQPGALLAAGPDVIPGAWVEARPIDLLPTLLAHFEVLPPPGPAPRGRMIHQIFRWAHPDRPAESSAATGRAADDQRE